MAASTIAFVNTTQAAAIPFYHTFPNEPIPGTDSVMVSKSIPLKGVSVAGLLAQIVEAKLNSGSNILIVGHGNDLGLNFEFGGTGKDLVKLELGALDAIRHAQEGSASDDDTAQTLMLGLATWKRIRGLLEKVQKLGLDRVDLRACKVGKDPIVLSAFQQFFGCNTACAPVLYDEFGLINFGTPTPDPAVWAQWMKDHKDFIMTGAAAPDRCAVAVQWAPNLQFFGMADSSAAMANWVKVHLPAGSYHAGDPVYFHGVTELGKSPIYAGEPDFRKNLKEAQKGKVPSRKIDVRQMQLVP